MVVAAEDGLHGDAAADDIFASDGDLQAFFHQTELEVAAGGGGRLEAVEEELEWLLNEDAFPALETMEALTGPRTKPMAAERRCQHCGATTTPQWRQGPEGPRTLCNACGVRYRSGRLLPEYRPLNSPTFSPEAHSNKHRCVVEMRLRPGSSGADANALGPLTSPFPRSSRSRKVLKKQKTTTGSCRGRRQMPSSHIHRGSSGSWYGNGGKVWFLQGLEATAVGGGGGGARLAVEHGRVTADGDGREEAVGVGASDHGGVPAATGTNVEPLATTACGGGCTCGCREGTRFRRGLDCCGTKTMLQRREAVAAGEHEVLSSKDTFPAMEPEPSVVLPPTEGVLRRGRAQTSSLSPQRCPATEPGQRRCRHCGTTETPQWREGPEGRGTLCNACGVRYGKGRLVPEYRPLSSPTFSAELHSNMQRSIVQMTLPGK